MIKRIFPVSFALIALVLSALFIGRSMEAVSQNITTMFIPATQVIFIFTILIIVLAFLLLREREERKSWESKCDELLQENVEFKNIIMDLNDNK